MIEYALLVMLGFCAAGLLALLIAPTIWRRAVRLTTKRLDATLPMSLSDIEADKDLLRASYAIQIRRLEAALAKARDKSAGQLVDISKLQMVIGEFRDRVAALERQLEERSNAANVFERTIKKRFPELEAALAAAKAALDERAYEIAELNNTLRRKEEALSLAQRAAGLQQSEIRKLRETLEGSAVDRTGRFKKRPAQWTLEEFRSEYDRLHLELSKMREQLALAQERESGQVAVLRAELQNLAEQIMTAAAAQEKQMAEQRRADSLPAAPAREAAVRPGRRTPPERPAPAPEPWPGGGERAPQNPVETAKPATVTSPRPESAPPATPKPEEAKRAQPDRAGLRPAEPKRPSITNEASPVGTKPETSALKTLLDRAAAVAPKDGNSGAASGSGAAAAQRQAGAPPAKPAPSSGETKSRLTADVATSAPLAPSVGTAVAEAGSGSGAQPVAAKAGEPNVDRMLKEIFEGKPGQAQPLSGETAPAGPAPEAAEKPAPVAAENAAREKPGSKAEEASEAEKKQSLLERLRVV